jgi:anti-anti-sigma factor
MRLPESSEVKVLYLPAVLDATNAAALTRAVEGALSTGFVAIVIDCTETEAIDSAGLHAVVVAHQVAELTVVGVRPAVARMLAVTRLDRVLNVRHSADEAILEHTSSRWRLCS